MFIDVAEMFAGGGLYLK